MGATMDLVRHTSCLLYKSFVLSSFTDAVGEEGGYSPPPFPLELPLQLGFHFCWVFRKFDYHAHKTWNDRAIGYRGTEKAVYF